MASLVVASGLNGTSSAAEALATPSPTSVVVASASVEASVPSSTKYAWKQHELTDPVDVTDVAAAADKSALHDLADDLADDLAYDQDDDQDDNQDDDQDELALPTVKLAADGVRGVPGRTVPRPQKKDMCISIEDGFPSNIHYGDVDQFRTIDNGACKPALSMVDNSCAAHMDIATRCASFCAQSYHHFYGEPHDLMGGSMCRDGENCELKQETSKSLQISNKVVDRHVRDTTISITPGASWAYGFNDVSIPLPGGGGSNTRGKRSAERKAKLNRRAEVAAAAPPYTGHKLIDSIIKNMYDQSVAEASGMLFHARTLPIGYGEDYEENVTVTMPRNHTVEMAEAADETTPFVSFKSWWRNLFGKKQPPQTAAAGGAPVERPTITLPIPSITNPTSSLSATFTRHWLKESVHTHYRASQEAEFSSLTHKQVPGDGCGSFSLVPIQIGTCGWQALPRVPRHMQGDVLDWLSSAPIDEIDSSDFKRGVWSKDGAHRQHGRYQSQMWEIGPGGCPATYHEFPTCTHSYAKKPDGTAMGRVVFVKKDCDTGRPLAHHLQPRPYRESIVFDEFFQHHLLRDPRLFNPHLGHLPPLANRTDSEVYGDE